MVTTTTTKKSTVAGAKPRPFEKLVPPGRDAVRIAPANEVIARLSGLGRNWTPDIAKVLAVPARLMVSESDTAAYYTSDTNGSMGNIVLAINARAKPDKPGFVYGLAIYETGNSTYLVIADMKRRIIVRERLSCYQNQPVGDDWNRVNRAITAAVSAAHKSTGMIFSDNGQISTMEFANEQESVWKPPTVPKIN